MKVTKTVHPDGTYYRNEHDELHREDGPAIIWPNGYKEYYLNNEKYSYTEWLKLIPNPIMIKWREYCEVN